MPGIYVRTLSQFDWLNQEKESLLTIPGSYWLCHKKNIYKFIFRYHRTVKNTMQFSYGRELLKIIRRIIKCHPTQGQQFGTQHLLVTYNCTSWTRQDKMFAILKFQQRTNAAAFSHAFVLTIRTFSSSDHSLFNLKYPIVKEADPGTTFKDLNASLDSEEKMISTVGTTDESSKNTAVCQTNKEDQTSKYNAIENMLNEALKTTISSNLQDDDTQDSASFRENLSKSIDSGTAMTELHFIDEHNTEFHNNIQESQSINCNTERCDKDIKQLPIDCVQEQSLRAKKTDEIEVENTNGIKKESATELVVSQKGNQHIQDVHKYKIFSSSKPFLKEITKSNDNDCLLSNKLNFNEKSMDTDDICIIDNKDNLNNDKEIPSENIINFSNLPIDQYFIKKETEDVNPNLIIDQSVQSTKNLQIEIKNINKDCIPKLVEESNKSVCIKQKDIYNEMTKVQENDRQHTRTSMNIDNKESEDIHSKSYKTRKQKTRESEKKTVSDKVLRSSNITDLVMEGLMFTIRQDQDSVAVIEQKTKLEMDEVLENSEKVETKAGEKCLLNSSLLRLENLVTMIDSQCNRDEHKYRHVDNGANLSFNAFPNDVIHNINTNVDVGMDKSTSVFNYNRRNTMTHLHLYQSQWQHQCVPSNIKNNSDSCLAGITTEKSQQLMEWQDSDNEQDKKCKNNIEIRKQEEDIPEISSSKINAGPQDTNLLMRNIEEVDKHQHDKSMERHYNSSLPYSSLNSYKISTKAISVISEESNLIKLSGQEANIPRVVSNKAVSIEQMPLALQKVLGHSCRVHKFSSTTSSGVFQQNEQKIQHMTLTGTDINTISEVDVSEDKCTNPKIANNSLSEKVKSNNEKPCVMMDKDSLEANRDTRVKNSKRKNDTRTLRRSSSSKHDSPRKLQDITEEFYYDLLHVHNKDNAIRQRCLRQKQRSLNNLDDIRNGKVRIEMLKFIQDITEGAKVVVRRLNIDNKSNLLN